MSIVLPVPHIPQRYTGQCLAACAAMLLTYLNISVTYKQLLNKLQIKHGIGTPASKIYVLESLGVKVIYEMGNFLKLHDHLIHNRPCIAFVQTRELPYWSESSSHAVVLAGLDEKFVYLNDPAIAQGPMRVSRGDFDLAWLEQDEFYATLIPH